jgi:hypothetical protein
MARHGLANERGYYPLPGTCLTHGPEACASDVLLFRGESHTLWGSVRLDAAAGQANWSAVVETTIPNDNSNLNTGLLPNGSGVFMVSNIAPAHVRDPLTVSLSKDGYDWSACKVVMSCTDMLGGNSTCAARQAENRNIGPSYPQGASVVAPADPALRGLYVVATNNKEDVVVAKVAWEALLDGF